jgi:mgtE-like transporter
MHHHLKRRRVSDSARRYIPEIISGQLFSITGGLIAGVLLSHFRHSFEPVVGFLVLLPGVIDSTGNIQGSLSARLNHTVLHWPALHKDSRAWQNNRLAAYLLGMVAGLILGLIGMAIAYGIYHQLNFKLLGIAFISCTLVNGLLTPLIAWLTDRLYEKGHDPDNVMGPIVTSLADIGGIAVLGGTVFLLF